MCIIVLHLSIHLGSDFVVTDGTAPLPVLYVLDDVMKLLHEEWMINWKNYRRILTQKIQRKRQKVN